MQSFRKLWLLSSLAVIAVTVFGFSAVAGAKEYPVSSASEIRAAMNNVGPGDTLIMQNGTWKDQNIKLTSSGKAEEQVTLRAETPGQVILSGNSSLQIDGSYVVVSGLLFTDGFLPAGSAVIRLNGNHNRLTDCAVVDYNPPGKKSRYSWVSLKGNNHRADHCYFSGQKHSGVTLVVELDGTDDTGRHLVDHNYFGNRPEGDGNGFETIRIGTSTYSMQNARVTVEYNLFEKCDGEIEMVSNKSCENIYRFNTFRESAACLTLRHGNRCLVEGNFFLGGKKAKSGGVRVIGEDHTVINNYFEGTMGRVGGTITLWVGVPNSELNGYFQIKKALIAFNTVVNNSGPCILLDAGVGERDRTLLPEGVVIANNILYNTVTKDPLIKGTKGDDIQFEGNIGYGSALGYDVPEGLLKADPDMSRGKDGLLHPSSSAVRGSAAGNYPVVKIDIDGQARGDKKDVGCDQQSDAPVVNVPLTAADVGVSWPIVKAAE
jgi:poly(beta-D-mannuronate) lyase